MNKENKKESKILEIESYLDNLSSYIPTSLDEYIYDSKTKDACERCFEKIVEAIIDLAFIIIKERNLSIPEEEDQVFEILLNNSIISNDLYKKLKEAKGMRNFIVHQYTKINDELVFNSISEELIPDVRLFLECINKIA
ncbi:MAG TPA: DUF86 domain-containing protein [Candidatus Paceibacterota bacterium]|nr:DUF86 domain-containing protein [Candidatus Paceibacterota bacterium]